MFSSYTRNTELRNVHTKDIYNLSVILDDENYWQTLMEVIPKELNNEKFSTSNNFEENSLEATYERKYNNDHIRLIENAIRRPGESRLYSQILFDEWGSSGRKHERPTLGVLLHLLVKSKLYRAADYVAELLNEPKPPRPTNGPAAEYEFKIDLFNDIKEAVNDTRFYPNTEELQDNVNIDNNKDYYTKYHQRVDKIIPPKNDNISEDVATTAPKPPPRLLKSARLLKQKQQQQQQQQQQLDQLLQPTAINNNVNNEAISNDELHFQQNHQINTQSNNENVSSIYSINNMPKLSALMSTTKNETTTTIYSMVDGQVLPKLSELYNSSESFLQQSEEDKEYSTNSTPSLIYTKPNIAANHCVTDDHDQHHTDMTSIPIVVLSKSLNIANKKDEHKHDNTEYNELHLDLPAISALNLNGERDHAIQQSNNLENISSSVSLNIPAHRINNSESGGTNEDFYIPYILEDIHYQKNHSSHLNDTEANYNGIKHEHDSDVEDKLDDDEDSIPNLSFLENRSSNNESSLTSVTNTSGENSFEHSVNDCSSNSMDNVPILSVLNQ